MRAGIEIRAGASLKASHGRLTGYAAVFDSPSQDLGGFVEIVRPGAFARSLQDADRILALLGHDTNQVLGRVGSGTLRLQEDPQGLAFDLSLPDTSYGRDLAVLVERGDVAGCSFGFRVRDGGDRWKTGEPAVRELLNVELIEITVTAMPAYPDTAVALRSLRNRQPVADNRPCYLWLETCR